MKNHVPRWKSVARRAIVSSIWLLLFLGASARLQAQATFYTFGNPGTNDGGTVIVPDPAGFLPFGHFLIAGYTNRTNGDNTFIMEVDATGAIFNQAVFKLSDPGSNDRLTDLRFDQAGDLIGCGYNFGPPLDHNGWYFKIPAALGALTWQHRIFPGPNNEVFQPFCMIETFPGGAIPEYVLSGKRWDPVMLSENPWTCHVAAATGALTTQNWLDFPPNERPDLFVNMMQFNNTLYGLGDIDFAIPAAPFNAYCRPSITSLNDNTLMTAGPGNNAYLRGLGIQAEIHATDFIDMFNDRYMCTGYGYMQYWPNNWNTFWLNRTVAGIMTDPALHVEYDFPAVQNERSEEVVIYGTNQAVMLVEGDDPGTGLDIYLAGVDAANGTPFWARKYGDPVASEYLFHGSQSQMAVIGPDLFFIGIRNDGSEDVLLVREPTVVPNLTQCVDTVMIVMTPLDRDTAFKWQDHPDMQFENPQAEVIIPTPLPDTIVCATTPPTTCWAETDPTYLHYFVSTALPPGYTLWPDRVFLDNGVIVQVPAGATLDITQADIVLDECARIEVLPGGHLRANNSTFRPCEELLTWDGIYFYESAVSTVPNASGFFNDCVFKNMLNGIFINPVPVVGMTPFDVRITDNSFINCFMAIELTRSVFTEAITGNTFTVDNRGINYLPTGCFSVPPYTPASPFHIGIIANGGTFEGSISQNNFINTLDQGNITRLEGITLIGVNEANITLNNFTNCWYAVGIVQSQNIAVENNEIEITQQYNAQQTQIWFELSTTIWVDGNHLVNSVEDYTTALVLAAIYTEDSRQYNIKENTVEGFIVGIEAIRTTGPSQILENKITNCNLAGIWIEEGAGLDVACNNIKVRRHDPAGTIGIRYQTAPNVPPGNMRFRGNCIFEAVTSMVFINPGGLCIPPPIIENNFLYDYTGTGMLFQFFTGNVGAPFANALNSAHNTFTSNNGGVVGFFDVTNVTPGPCAIGMGGNWGIQAVSAGVAILPPGGNVFHSYASCGLQIDNNPAQIWNMDDQCDLFIDNITVFIPNIVGGDYDAFEARLTEIKHPEYAPIALFIVAHKHGVDVARPYFDHLMAGSLLSVEAKALLRYDWLLYNGDFTAAATQLAAIGITPKGISGIMQLEQLRIKLLVEGRNWTDLTPTEMQMVLDFEQSGDVNADVARAYLNLVKGDRPYLPEPIVMPTFEQGVKSLGITTATDHMEIFPNPSNSRLNVKFNFVNETTPVLRVTDVMGRTVYMEAMDMSAGTFTVDISTYTPGAYVVSLECPGSKSLHQHLLKF